MISKINRITYKEDTRIPNAGNFFIPKYDETLGNLLKSELLDNKEEVIFAGYIKKHPLENNI